MVFVFASLSMKAFICQAMAVWNEFVANEIKIAKGVRGVPNTFYIIHNYNPHMTYT